MKPLWFVTVSPWHTCTGLRKMLKLRRITATLKPYAGDYGHEWFCFVRASTEREAQLLAWRLFDKLGRPGTDPSPEMTKEQIATLSEHLTHQLFEKVVR